MLIGTPHPETRVTSGPPGSPVVAREASAGACLVLACISFGASAQTIDDIRAELREGLRDTHFAKGLVGLVLAADEVELSGGIIGLDDTVDTEIFYASLPFQRSLDAFGEDRPKLYLEGALGYARADQSSDDIYAGAAPTIATSIDTEWSTLAGLLGVGMEFQMTDELALTPIANIGIAHLENDTDYAGPGAAATAAIADGIAFNWDALAFSYGLAGRAEWDRELTEQIDLSLVGRYDLRWTESLNEDDPAQEFSTRSQTITVRADLVGPTGLQLFERDVNWRTFVGGRHFLEGDFFDVEDFAEIGAGLETPTSLVGSMVSVTGAVLFGEDLVGYSMGVGISF